MSQLYGGVDYEKIREIVREGLRRPILVAEPSGVAWSWEITDLRWFPGDGYLYATVYPGKLYRIDPDTYRVELVKDFGAHITFWNYLSSGMGNFWRSGGKPHLTFVGVDGANGYLLSTEDGENWMFKKLDGELIFRLGWWNLKWVISTSKAIYMPDWGILPANFDPTADKVADNPDGLACFTDIEPGKTWSERALWGIGRRDTDGDGVPDSLVLRKSTDGGVTWSDVKVYSEEATLDNWEKKLFHTRDGAFAPWGYTEPTVGYTRWDGFYSGSHAGALAYFPPDGSAEIVLELPEPVPLSVSRRFGPDVGWHKFAVLGWGHHNEGGFGYLAVLNFTENTVKLVRLGFSPSSCEIIGDELWVGEAWRAIGDHRYRIYRLDLRWLLHEAKPYPISGYFREKGNGLKWDSKSIDAGAYTSRIPAWGYNHKYIYFLSDTAGNLTIEVDAKGDGSFKTYDTVPISANSPENYVMTGEAKWVRLTFDTAAVVTAMYNFR